MTAITAGSVTAAPTAQKTAAVAQKPLFTRLWAAFVESRMRQAEREIRLHQHLLPHQFQVAGDRLTRGDKELAFIRND
jgi:hypothetical protein